MIIEEHSQALSHHELIINYDNADFLGCWLHSNFRAGREAFLLFDYEHVAKGGQWGTLPIFLAGSCQRI
jgi:hypothetical protein